MKEQLEAIRSAAKAALDKVSGQQEIEELRVRFLGQKGRADRHSEADGQPLAPRSGR